MTRKDAKILAQMLMRYKDKTVRGHLLSLLTFADDLSVSITATTAADVLDREFATEREITETIVDVLAVTL